MFAWFDGPVRLWSIGDFLIALVIIGGAVALDLIALREMGIAIPGWVKQMFWVVLVVVVAVVLIRFVLSL